MPANIVKPGQEKYWERAKKRAAEQGRAEDWAYITGIFKKMTLNKSFVIFSRNKEGVTPGQVPDPRRHEAYQLLTEKPKVVTEKMLLIDDSPRLTIRSIVQSLGFSQEDEQDWYEFLEREIPGRDTTHGLNAAFLARAREQDLDPHLRLALYRRIQQYFKDAGERERPIEVLQPLKKAVARGGTYHARVPKPGGGYRYFYDEAEYRNSKGAHVRGHEAASAKAHHDVHAHIQKHAEKGASHQELRELAKKHGPRAVAQALKGHHEAGTLHYQGGRFYSGGVSHEEPKGEGSGEGAVRRVSDVPGNRNGRLKGRGGVAQAKR